MRRNSVVVFATMGAIVGIYAAMTLVVFLLSHVSLGLATTSLGANRLSLGILIFGALVSTAMVGGWIALGVTDIVDGVPISRLYPPMLCIKIFLMVQTNFYGLQAIDLLLHNLHPSIRAFSDPEVRIAQSLSLLMVFVSLMWLLVALLRSRDRLYRNLVVAIFFLSGGVAAILALVLANVALKGGIRP